MLLYTFFYTFSKKLNQNKTKLPQTYLVWILFFPANHFVIPIIPCYNEKICFPFSFSSFSLQLAITYFNDAGGRVGG